MEKDWLSSFLEKLPIKKEWLPSKKLILIFGGIGFLWLSFSTVVFLKDNFLKDKIGFLIASNESSIDTEKDTDGDGLLDWEEIAIGTDIKKKDTDGDGVDDGDEVKKGKHPLISGPDDVIVSDGIIYKSVLLDGSGYETDTSDFINNWFEGYISLQNSGISSEDNQVSLVKNLLLENSGKKNKNIYTLSDLNISEENTKEKAEIYKAKLVEILEKEPEYNIFKNTDLILNIIQTGDLNIEEVEIYKQSHKETFDEQKTELLLLETPIDIAESHLFMVNTLDEIIFMIDGIGNDPFSAITSVVRYLDINDSFLKEVDNIVFYLDSFGLYESY